MAGLVNPLTNLADIDVHFLRIISPSTGESTEVRDKFVDKEQIASVAPTLVQVTPEYAFSELAWPQNPTDDDVPGLDSLLRWLQQEGLGGGVRNYHITRNSFTHLTVTDNVVTLAGRKGRHGRRGALGFAGEDGLSRRGRRGVQGVRGKRGFVGLTAEDGGKGRRGERGSRGRRGLLGDEGPTGPRGRRGERGVQGDTGPQGVQGIQGEVGPEGEQGPQGDRGPQGEQGFQGPAGPTGSQGTQGPQGPVGDTGPGRHYQWVLSENNYSMIRKREFKHVSRISIQTPINRTTRRTTNHHRHSHVAIASEATVLAHRGVSKAYADERFAALLAMIVDLQAEISP